MLSTHLMTGWLSSPFMYLIRPDKDSLSVSDFAIENKLHTICFFRLHCITPVLHLYYTCRKQYDFFSTCILVIFCILSLRKKTEFYTHL